MLGAGRKLPLHSGFLTPFPFPGAQHPTLFLVPKQKVLGDETASSFTGGNKPPFHCAKNLAPLSPNLGRDSSTYVQAVACLIHRVLYCSSHENASHRPLPTGNSTGLEPQLLCSKIHHLGLLPVDDQGNRDTKANPILGGKGLYPAILVPGLPQMLCKESLDHVTVEGVSIKLSFPQSISNLAFPDSLPFFSHR